MSDKDKPTISSCFREPKVARGSITKYSNILNSKTWDPDNIDEEYAKADVQTEIHVKSDSN